MGNDDPHLLGHVLVDILVGGRGNSPGGTGMTLQEAAKEVLRVARISLEYPRSGYVTTDLREALDSVETHFSRIEKVEEEMERILGKKERENR